MATTTTDRAKRTTTTTTTTEPMATTTTTTTRKLPRAQEPVAASVDPSPEMEAMRKQLEELQATLARRDKDLELVTTKLATATARRARRAGTSSTVEVTLDYPDMETFRFKINSTPRESTCNVYNTFSEWRRGMSMLTYAYRENATDEVVAQAKTLHAMMIAGDTSASEKTEQYRQRGIRKNKPETDDQLETRLNLGYGNFSKVYIVFVATFKEHIKPYAPFMNEIDKLRTALNEFNAQKQAQ